MGYKTIMPLRKEMLVTGEVYHIFNKSIAGFKIFNNQADFSRIVDVISYYQKEKQPISFSNFIKIKHGFSQKSLTEGIVVEIIAYCIMPTHIHLILKQLKNNGITAFIGNILNSYTRYFNIKYNRKGPLWQGRFKNVIVENEEQLLHLTRYIHLNPVTGYLVNKPEEWSASSYKEYLSGDSVEYPICNYSDFLPMVDFSYKKFVDDHISYQKEVVKIKDLIVEN
ncbi:MAG: transposase [Candidatus Omnitrophica bacterium]|nr:transposase [Candidatus Omnitrophota bacterium]